MYNFFKKNIKRVTLAVLLLSSLPSVYAASLSIVAADQALSTREPFVVSLVVDAQQDTLSGIAGSFSFQSDLFNIIP